MAEVKLKNGYIKIANNLFEQLFIRDFTLKQLRILLLIFRLSYGFNKTDAVVIPFARFDVANIHKCDVRRVLTELWQRNIILCDFENNVFTLNKNFDEWTVNFHSTFSDEKFVNLKSKQFANHKHNERKKVCNPQTRNVCETQTDLKKGLQNTNPDICKIQTKNKILFVNHKRHLLVNRHENRGTTCRKYIIKDIYKYIYIKEKIRKNKYKNLSENKPKKIDPFFNPIVTYFKSEYQKVFNQRCYLNSNQTKKLIEINAENPEFKSDIPDLLKKYKSTVFEFENGSRRASLRWLIEEGNWSGILNGDFEMQKKKGEYASSDYYTN